VIMDDWTLRQHRRRSGGQQAGASSFWATPRHSGAGWNPGTFS